jgi:hypothetical protein
VRIILNIPLIRNGLLEAMNRHSRGRRMLFLVDISNSVGNAVANWHGNLDRRALTHRGSGRCRGARLRWGRRKSLLGIMLRLGLDRPR